MKISRDTSIGCLVGRASPRAGLGMLKHCDDGSSVASPHRKSGFTMIEIAICLAIIGIALVSIIGVLPMGLNVQKDNREETIINQDATVFMEAIRNGARGADDLTNYVYAITNYWTNITTHVSGANGYTYAGYHIAPSYPSGGTPITNGLRIIGLLSAPEYTDLSLNPTNNLFSGGYSYSNHIVAYVRSVSGPASEKPPQDNNGTIRMDSFSYKILCENVPVAVDTNALNSTNVFDRVYAANLTANLHELRLTFLWPLQPNGKAGNGRQTFRTTVAGQIVQTNDSGQQLYFFQPQSFTNVSTP